MKNNEVDSTLGYVLCYNAINALLGTGLPWTLYSIYFMIDVNFYP
jgi:hypothetical protein